MKETDNSKQVKWGRIHSNIALQLFESLEKNKIKYFILRNYEGLPETNNSKDIDIIIEPGTYKKAFQTLSSIFLKNDIEYIHIVKYERVHCIYGMNIKKELSIHIDFIEGYSAKGFEIFSFNLLYANTEKYNGLTVLNQPFDAIMLLYYKVIGTKELKEKYREKISSIYNISKPQIEEIIYNTLSRKQGFLITEALEEKNFDKIIKNSEQMSNTAKMRTFLHTPLSTAINVSKFLLGKFYRIVICPRNYQNFISVQGADGTGKSTFIEGLCKKLAFYYVTEENKFHLYHFRPTIFPNLGAVGEKMGAMKEDKDFTNPHRAKPSGFVSSMMRMIYYWLDYLIGAPILLRRDVQFDKFTVYDRYIYDFLVDPHRSRINLPYWMRKLFVKTVIQPRIVFVLLADAEIIYNRKQELTIEEIERQLALLSKLAKSNKRFVVIDANQTPQKMVDAAVKVIIDNFTTKSR